MVKTQRAVWAANIILKNKRVRQRALLLQKLLWHVDSPDGEAYFD
jgi:hypothetical protein